MNEPAFPAYLPGFAHPPRDLTRSDLLRAINSAQLEGFTHYASALRGLYQRRFGRLPASTPHIQADKARTTSPAHC